MDYPGFHYLEYLLIFLAVYFARIYGTIIGGGSFVIQPLLISLGLPPSMAVAQDVSTSIGSNIGGIYGFKGKNIARYDIIKWWIPGFVLGPILGARLMVELPEDWIENIIGFLAIFAILYLLLLKKHAGIYERALPHNWKAYAIFFSFLEGIYVGFSGAGVSLLHNFLLISVFGTTFLQGLAIRYITRILSCCTAFIVYYYYGLVVWPLFLLMLIASSMAGYTASSVSLKLGNRYLKYLFCVFVLILAVYIIIK